MYDVLTNSKLFDGMNKSEIIHLFNITHHQIKEYESEQLILMSGSKCQHLYILVLGSIRGEMIDNNGKVIKIEDVFAPDTFAEGFIFAENPIISVDAISNEKSKIISIYKDDFLNLLHKNKRILQNYLTVISNRFLTVTKKIKTLNLTKLEGKLANYFLHQENKHMNKTFHLNLTHQQLADYFGVTRPSLSREISRLSEVGAIKVNRKKIEIIDKKYLIDLIKN